jgi:hypothetical protein
MLLLLLSTQQLLLMMVMVVLSFMIFTIHYVRHWSGNSEGTPLCWLQSDQWWSLESEESEVDDTLTVPSPPVVV